MKATKKQIKILDIISFVGVFIFFIFALICALFRFSGAKFNLFGNRYDVVLTDSMSEKNEKYEDFLAGHDDQIKAFDLVKSVKIEKPEDLNVYDIVVFNNRDIGTDTHRIVDKIVDTDNVTFSKSSIKKIGDYEGVCLEETASNISTNSISFSTLEMTSYSLKEDPNDYYFYIMNKTFEPEITTVKQGDGYLHTYKITRDTTAPGKVLISHNAIYDYSIQVITSIKMDARLGAISCDTSNLKSSNGDLRADYNFDYRFEIRGDKAKNSDGIYTFDEIESKVVKVMPGMGYFIRFLGSLWGGIMFILLGVLFLVFDIVMNHLNKKEALATADNSSLNVEQKPAKEEPTDDKNTENPVTEETKLETPKTVEEKPEQPKVEKPAEPAKKNGKFIPKGGGQKRLNWPPKNTRWTKENNPTANKKRAEGGDK